MSESKSFKVGPVARLRELFFARKTESKPSPSLKTTFERPAAQSALLNSMAMLVNTYRELNGRYPAAIEIGEVALTKAGFDPPSILKSFYYGLEIPIHVVRGDVLRLCDASECIDCGRPTTPGPGSARCPECWDDRCGGAGGDGNLV